MKGHGKPNVMNIIAGITALLEWEKMPPNVIQEAALEIMWQAWKISGSNPGIDPDEALYDLVFVENWTADMVFELLFYGTKYRKAGEYREQIEYYMRLGESYRNAAKRAYCI